MQTNSSLDEQIQLFSHARDFEWAAGLLGASEFKDQIVQPQVVLSAFCLELYFKCLLHIENGSYPHGHELLKLFDKLTLIHQKRIEQHYLDFQREKLKARPNRKWLSVRRILEISNDAFETWRYSCESPNETLEYCAGVLIPCVKKVIGEDCFVLKDDGATQPGLMIGFTIEKPS